MNRLYIRFAGDNDFSNTVSAFVKAIAPRILAGSKNITKAKIVELFNAHAYSLYCLHQAWDFDSNPDVKEYLKVEEKDIYFDDEVKEYTNFNLDGCLAVANHDNKISYVVM